MTLITLKEHRCQTFSSRKIFGLCDDPPPSIKEAYIDEVNGEKWIAVVENDYCFNVTFTAVDHCIAMKNKDGKDESRCDGVLSYNSTVIFVELKERSGVGVGWIKDAESQLKASILNFEKNIDSDNYSVKKAYIANNEHPKFKFTQAQRMDRFQLETGYTLRIENRIKLR